MLDIISQIEKAKEELKIAEQQLNNADDEFLDSAIHNYSSKKSKISALVKIAKKEGVAS